MKDMNKKNFMPMNLQFFAEGADDNADQDNGGAGDADQEDNGGEEEQEPEKYFTQAEMDKAIEKRLARERKKWEKESTKEPEKAPDQQIDPKIKAAEDKVAELEIKLICYEQGVTKDSVDDVMALARSYAKDDDDIEDAIEKVLKKYPQFKALEKEPEQEPKSWGQRQSGKTPKDPTKMTYEEYKAYRTAK